MSVLETMNEKELSSTNQILPSIINLPDDVIYLILSYCNAQTLGRLCRVCKRFHAIVLHDCVWHLHSKRGFLIENPQSSKNGQKSYRPLKEKCRISKNWIKAKYRETSLLRYSVKQLPWLQLQESLLWVSRKNEILCFEKKRDGEFREKFCCKASDIKDDIRKFMVKDDTVISGCCDGSVSCWESETGKLSSHYENIHNGEIHAVDFHGNTGISGSRDAKIKVFSTLKEDSSKRVKHEIDTGERVWSLQISTDGSSFTYGTAGCTDEIPLSTYDFNTCQLISSLQYQHKRGAGILDIKYETPQSLLTCGYDCFLRLWDLRTQSCVREWEDSFNLSLYCIQSDGHMTILTGTAMHGLVRLWDKRFSKSVQMYYTGHRHVKSPVYSVAHDGERMFTALDKGVNILNFTGI